jgi:hypothetical protein
MENLFTIICEFRGSTYTKQVRASVPAKALRTWAEAFKKEGFLPKNKVADFEEEIENSLSEGNIVALESLQNVWYEAFSIEDDLLEILVVNTSETEVLTA